MHPRGRHWQRPTALLALRRSMRTSMSRARAFPASMSPAPCGKDHAVCVLTLEPFDSDLAEEVDVDFAEAPASAQAATQADILLGAQSGDRDPPDPIEDGAIDLGALAAEFLALGLDPYPRRPGAEFAPVTDPHDVIERPFDALKKLTDQS